MTNETEPTHTVIDYDSRIVLTGSRVHVKHTHGKTGPHDFQTISSDAPTMQLCSGCGRWRTWISPTAYVESGGEAEIFPRTE